MSDWQPPGPPPYQPPPYQPPPYQPPPGAPYGQPYPPPYGYGPIPPRTAGNAVAALVLSLLAWMLCPVIPAIVALVLAGGAKREIERSGGAVTGEGLVTAARIISWIHLGLVTAGVLIVVLLFIVGAASSNTGTATVHVHRLLR